MCCIFLWGDKRSGKWGDDLNGRKFLEDAAVSL
jgi:hypothetical protein